MDTIYFLLFISVGFTVFTFTMMQCSTILFFGIRITLKLNRLGFTEKNNKILKHYLVSIIVLTTIFVIICTIVNMYSSHLIAYLIGCIFSLFIGFGQTVRINSNNVRDYMDSNKSKFTLTEDKIINIIYSIN